MKRSTNSSTASCWYWLLFMAVTRRRAVKCYICFVWQCGVKYVIIGKLQQAASSTFVESFIEFSPLLKCIGCIPFNIENGIFMQPMHRMEKYLVWLFSPVHWLHLFDFPPPLMKRPLMSVVRRSLSLNLVNGIWPWYYYSDRCSRAMQQSLVNCFFQQIRNSIW